MKNIKLTTQIKLEESYYFKLKQIAEKELRTLDAQMEYFIIRGIESYEKSNGAIPLKKDS